MKGLVIVLLIVGVTVAFILQKRNEQAAATAPTAKTSAVSEHDWAKHSLDRAAEVKREVLRQRASNDPASR